MLKPGYPGLATLVWASCRVNRAAAVQPSRALMSRSRNSEADASVYSVTTAVPGTVQQKIRAIPQVKTVPAMLHLLNKANKAAYLPHILARIFRSRILLTRLAGRTGDCIRIKSAFQPSRDSGS